MAARVGKNGEVMPLSLSGTWESGEGEECLVKAGCSVKQTGGRKRMKEAGAGTGMVESLHVGDGLDNGCDLYPSWSSRVVSGSPIVPLTAKSSCSELLGLLGEVPDEFFLGPLSSTDGEILWGLGIDEVILDNVPIPLMTAQSTPESSKESISSEDRRKQKKPRTCPESASTNVVRMRNACDSCTILKCRCSGPNASAPGKPCKSCFENSRVCIFSPQLKRGPQKKRGKEEVNNATASILPIS